MSRQQRLAEASAAPPRAVLSRPTAFEVAARAGVAQSTVSRALNGHPSVRPETRQRVMEVAAAMGYAVDYHAARLRTGASGAVAMIVLADAGPDGRRINPLYMSLVQSVAEAAAARDLDLLLSVQDSERLFGGYQDSGRAEGVIVVGSARNTAAWRYFQALSDAGRNILGWGAPDNHLRVLRSDNPGGGMLATEHLIATGRRRIVFVGPGAAEQQAYAERLAGYRAAMAAAGLAADVITDIAGDTREAQGRAAAAHLLARGTAVDAVFAACDQVAIGVMAALASAGLAVPDDIAVIGFDGIDAGRYTRPTLSTIAHDIPLAGRLLIDQLLAAPGTTSAPLPVRLLVRGSTAVPPLPADDAQDQPVSSSQPRNQATNRGTPTSRLVAGS